MANEKIIEINSKNISEYQPRCFMKADKEGYKRKVDWLKKRFSEGLKIKQLYLENEKKCNGFIEYVPAEYAWRSVNAKGYMFIHCIWITPNKFKNKGHGSMLIQEAIKDAKKLKMNGVVTIVSDGPFMADKKIFLKNGFKSIAKEENFDLMVKSFKKSPLPKFNDWKKQLKKAKGIQIFYSKQCPWVAESIDEFSDILKKRKLKFKIKELKTAKQAQNAPSIYSVFNLIKDGKLLADHYISKTRFLNIINKEMK